MRVGPSESWDDEFEFGQENERPRIAVIGRVTCELSTSSSYPSTPNDTFSAADTQHTHTHWFFRASSGTGSLGASSSTCPGSSRRDSIYLNKQRRKHESKSDAQTEWRSRSWKLPMLWRDDRHLRESPSSGVPRRNSLGDLKIPVRISQAQVGLRRDLGMVREFAMNIEHYICSSFFFLSLLWM